MIPSRLDQDPGGRLPPLTRGDALFALAAGLGAAAANSLWLLDRAHIPTDREAVFLAAGQVAAASLEAGDGLLAPVRTALAQVGDTWPLFPALGALASWGDVPPYLVLQPFLVLLGAAALVLGHFLGGRAAAWTACLLALSSPLALLGARHWTPDLPAAALVGAVLACLAGSRGLRLLAPSLAAGLLAGGALLAAPGTALVLGAAYGGAFLEGRSLRAALLLAGGAGLAFGLPTMLPHAVPGLLAALLGSAALLGAARRPEFRGGAASLALALLVAGPWLGACGPFPRRLAEGGDPGNLPLVAVALLLPVGLALLVPGCFARGKGAAVPAALVAALAAVALPGGRVGDGLQAVAPAAALAGLGAARLPVPARALACFLAAASAVLALTGWMGPPGHVAVPPESSLVVFEGEESRPEGYLDLRRAPSPRRLARLARSAALSPLGWGSGDGQRVRALRDVVELAAFSARAGGWVAARSLLLGVFPPSQDYRLSEQRIEAAVLEGEVLEAGGEEVRARLVGRVAARHPWWRREHDGRTLEARLVGYLRWLPRQQRFASFELLTVEGRYHFSPRLDLPFAAALVLPAPSRKTAGPGDDPG